LGVGGRFNLEVELIERGSPLSRKKMKGDMEQSAKRAQSYLKILWKKGGVGKGQRVGLRLKEEENCGSD